MKDTANTTVKRISWGLCMLAAQLALAACAEVPGRHLGHDWSHEQVTCNSEGWTKQRCAPEWRDARLLETLSREACRRGHSWDVDRRGLWVDDGCRGRFVRTDDDRRDDPADSDTITCSSEESRYRRCGLGHRVEHVELRRQLSVADCERGESWGWERRAIWVDKGCRAEFEVEWR